MKYFVTGAAGFIGSALVAELIKHGHEVVGLVRSEKSAKFIKAAGAQVLFGDLHDLEVLKKGAKECDGVAHLAFVVDFANFEAACKTDRQAISAICSVLKGTSKPFIITFGTLFLPNDHGPATEQDSQPEVGMVKYRIESEKLILNESKGEGGVIGMSMRLPPSVHGHGDRGFIPAAITSARKKKVSPYINDGTNVWPTVHVLDAARLYRLALEKPKAGTILHGVSEQGVCWKDIATVIGKQIDVPVRSIVVTGSTTDQAGGEDEAAEHFGFLSRFAGMDNPVSSEATRASFNWEPREVSLLADIESGHYFETGKESKFDSI